jgi:hypothetical protein
MSKLSPAAQAVLDAANGAQSYGSDDCLNESRWIAAAALRAAADQVVPESCFESDDAIRSKLLTIADELEKQTDEL